jgi:hypothetical protein
LFSRWQAELDIRLDERMGLETVSVVTFVGEKSFARRQGVAVGCVLLGVNFEKYISHAHTVATLKHVKRPVTIRFRRPPTLD